MDEGNSLTKKELKLQRKLEALNREKEEKKQGFTKWIFYSFLALSFVGFFIFIINAAKNNQNDLSSQAIEIPVNTNDHIKGDKNAKYTLVEYSDFECPACALSQPTVNEIMEKHSKNLRLVYKHFPLPGHANAKPAALAGEAAGMQEKFFGMHDILFQRQDEWSGSNNPQEFFEKYAQELELDMDKFKKDMNSDLAKQKVENDTNEAIKNGVNATPTFFLDGKKMSFGTYSDFKETIEKEIIK